MKRVDDFRLRFGKQELVPIVIGGMGVDISTADLALEAARLGGIGHISDAMVKTVADRRFNTKFVKDKLKQIAASMPTGMRVEPFYDRAALVSRTIGTVERNLLEGAALVILVLLLLLGDVRAGLIVATTIPLSLLIAIIVMQARGASGNLMSLGAIDFGLMVDGAVIIIENAVRRLGEARRQAGKPLSPTERLQVVEEATMEVRGATIFGEAIIAIVYLPILALSGIEGKLFHPMALTVLFALMGAFVLTLTFVPVLASYFLKDREHEQETWIVRKVHAFYVPLLARALRRRWVTISLGVALLSVAVGLFFRLGAEFVPQLDEGDLLVEVRRLPGVALSESIALEARVQKALRRPATTPTRPASVPGADARRL